MTPIVFERFVNQIERLPEPAGRNSEKESPTDPLVIPLEQVHASLSMAHAETVRGAKTE